MAETWAPSPVVEWLEAEYDDTPSWYYKFRSRTANQSSVVYKRGLYQIVDDFPSECERVCYCYSQPENILGLPWIEEDDATWMEKGVVWTDNTQLYLKKVHKYSVYGDPNDLDFWRD